MVVFYSNWKKKELIMKRLWWKHLERLQLHEHTAANVFSFSNLLLHLNHSCSSYLPFKLTELTNLSTNLFTALISARFSSNSVREIIKSENVHRRHFYYITYVFIVLLVSLTFPQCSTVHQPVCTGSVLDRYETFLLHSFSNYHNQTSSAGNSSHLLIL